MTRVPEQRGASRDPGLPPNGVEVATIEARGQVLLRLSAQLYNRPSDYQKLVKALETLRQK